MIQGKRLWLLSRFGASNLQRIRFLLPLEKWVKIDGYNHYEISTHGRLRTWDKTIRLRHKSFPLPLLLQQGTHSQGYKRVQLQQNCKFKMELIHRLVAKAFIHNPNRLNEVNHIDNIPSNNHYSNLEWCTHSENLKHAFAIGAAKRRKGEDAPNSKLTNKEVIEIREKFVPYRYTRVMLAKEYGVGEGCIKTIIRRKSWKHI